MHSPASLVARSGVTVFMLVALALLGDRAVAADHVLAGKKLLLKNPSAGSTGNKAVHLSKDAGITLGAAAGAGDPQCTGAGGGGTSSLRIAASGGAGDVTILLPCAGWSTNAANTLYKYKDSTGATCKLVLVKAGVLAKAVCKGAQVAIDLNGGMSPVAVVTTLNTEVYCTEFGGTAVKDGSDDKTFLRKDAAAPGACPGPPPPTTTSSTSSTTVTTLIPETTTTTSLPIACCRGMTEDFAIVWCNEGDASPGYETSCTSAEVNGTYYPGLRCNASTATCGATRTTAGCCEVSLITPSLPLTCFEAFGIAALACENLQDDPMLNLTGTWVPNATCDISTALCTEVPETVAPCGGPACSACGGTCSGLGGACAVAGGGGCGHTGSGNNVCYDVLTCTAATCSDDDGCPALKVCVGGNSCCSRCPS